MKRGKRFLKNENLFIYAGTAIFFILAIAIGIIMYMTTKTGNKIENGSEQLEAKVSESTESVTNDMGKTVEEQESSVTTESGTSESSDEEELSTSEKNTTSSNKVTQTNTEPEQELHQ